VVRESFAQRRKTLRNCLKPLMMEFAVTELPVDLGLRAENLELADFVRLSNIFTSLKSQP